MKTKEQLITHSKEILGGIPVFAGTRVPIRNLFDYLETDERLDDFLEDFPSVTREQATEVLELSKSAILAEYDADTA